MPSSVTSTKILVNFTHLFTHLFLCFILFLALPGSNWAAQAVKNQPQSSDVRVLIDVSGSMKKNDPRNLSQKSISLYALLYDVLSESFQPFNIAIIGFADTARIVLPLTPSDKVELDKVISRLSKEGKYTNIKAALEKTLILIEAKRIEPQDVFVILLTDGKVDVPDSVDIDKYFSLMDSVLNLYCKKGVVIHTVGLSTDIDEALLRKIATLTKGEFHRVKKAPDLLKVFSHLVSMQTGTLSKELSEEFKLYLEGKARKVEFSIPRSTPRFVISIVKPNRRRNFEIELIDPTGVRVECGHSGDCIFKETENSIVLIKSKPIEGTWTLKLIFPSENFARGAEVLSFLYLQQIKVEINAPEEKGYPYNDSVFFDVRLNKVDQGRFVNFEVFEVRAYIVTPFGEIKSVALHRIAPNNPFRYVGYTMPLTHEGIYTSIIEVIDTLSGTSFSAQRNFFVAPVPELDIEFKKFGLIGEKAEICVKPNVNIPTQIENLVLEKADLKVILKSQNAIDTIAVIDSLPMEGKMLSFTMPQKVGVYTLEIKSKMVVSYGEVELVTGFKGGEFVRIKRVPVFNGLKLKGFKIPHFLFWGDLTSKPKTHFVSLRLELNTPICLEPVKASIIGDKGFYAEITLKDTICIDKYGEVIKVPIHLLSLPIEGMYKVNLEMRVHPYKAPLVISYNFKRHSFKRVFLSFLLFIALLLGSVYIYKLKARPKFRGVIIYENVVYPLSLYNEKGEVTIGSQGDIKIESPEIKQKHVKIVATKMGDKIYPLEGDVDVDNQFLDTPDYGVILTHGCEIKLSKNVVLHYEIRLNKEAENEDTYF